MVYDQNHPDEPCPDLSERYWVTVKRDIGSSLAKATAQQEGRRAASDIPQVYHPERTIYHSALAMNASEIEDIQHSGIKDLKTKLRALSSSRITGHVHSSVDRSASAESTGVENGSTKATEETPIDVPSGTSLRDTAKTS
jgi:hypothetical protein